MASKKQQKGNNFPIIALLLIGAIGLTSLAAYVKFGGASKIPDSAKFVPAIQQPASNAGDGKVTLVTPSRDGNDLKLGKHESDVPAGENPIVFAINHFLKESKIVPEDAKAIGVQVKDGVALVDFTPSFSQSSYGSFDEEALLKGICSTLSQFPDVKKVQFFVEGKVVESIGNVDLSEPIPVQPTTEKP